jgi:hypothetical protein
MSMIAPSRAQQRKLEREANIAQWHRAEAKLKRCAETLTGKLGIADARVNHAQGDRRLYAITSYGQEESTTYVPGIDTRGSSFYGPYGYVTGRATGDKFDMAYGVENSPKGQLWSDPWGHISESMGRAPPSAGACREATLRYLEAYNATMLELGVLRKPVISRKDLIPARLQSVGVISGLYDSFDRGLTLEDYLDKLLRPIEVLATNPNVLTQADVDLDRARSLAMETHARMTHVMSYDRNDDGVVTRAEVERVVQRSGDTSILKRLFDDHDPDGDKRITKAEIGMAAAEWIGIDYHHASRVRSLIDLDPNRDGQLTSVELTMLGKRAFAAIDIDGNGLISPSEYDASEKMRWKVSQEAARKATNNYGPTCKMPAVPQEAKIIYVEVYTSKRSGSFLINGQQMSTQYIDLNIAPGREPLYIILGSYEGMMWKFSGATSRVAKVVISSFSGRDKSAAAAMAVPADRITLIRGKCRQYLYRSDDREVEAGNLVRRSIGRQPNRIISNYDPQTVTLP